MEGGRGLLFFSCKVEDVFYFFLLVKDFHVWEKQKAALFTNETSSTVFLCLTNLAPVSGHFVQHYHSCQVLVEEERKKDKNVLDLKPVCLGFYSSAPDLFFPLVVSSRLPALAVSATFHTLLVFIIKLMCLFLTAALPTRAKTLRLTPSSIHPFIHPSTHLYSVTFSRKCRRCCAGSYCDWQRSIEKVSPVISECEITFSFCHLNDFFFFFFFFTPKVTSIKTFTKGVSDKVKQIRTWGLKEKKPMGWL